jgi:hypothetical protein
MIVTCATGIVATVNSMLPWPCSVMVKVAVTVAPAATGLKNFALSMRRH